MYCSLVNQCHFGRKTDNRRKSTTNFSANVRRSESYQMFYEFYHFAMGRGLNNGSFL